MHIVEASFAGVGRHVIDLAEAQSNKHDVTVIYGTARRSDDFTQRMGGIKSVSWVPMEMSRNIGTSDVVTLFRCRGVLKKIQPDVVHGHSSKGGAIARLCASGKSSAYYTPNAIYTMNPELSGLKKWFISIVEHLLSFRTKGIVAVSPEERDHMIQLGIDKRKITVIPNGIEKPTKYTKADVRRELGLADDHFIIGFVGRIDNQKSPKKIIDIFKLYLAKTTVDTRLAIVGEGPMLNEMREYAQVQGVDDHIDWLGFQNGAWSMCAFDVFFLPSLYEGFPYVLLEAIGVGVPIITSDTANASQLITEDNIGHIVSYENNESFAECLVKVSDRCLNPLRKIQLPVLNGQFLMASMEKETTSFYSNPAVAGADGWQHKDV